MDVDGAITCVVDAGRQAGVALSAAQERLLRAPNGSADLDRTPTLRRGLVAAVDAFLDVDGSVDVEDACVVVASSNTIFGALVREAMAAVPEPEPELAAESQAEPEVDAGRAASPGSAPASAQAPDGSAPTGDGEQDGGWKPTSVSVMPAGNRSLLDVLTAQGQVVDHEGPLELSRADEVVVRDQARLRPGPRGGRRSFG